MIAWPIKIAHSSGLFDHIIVSTDDPVIGDEARRWGAEVPFVRPAELSDDHTGTTMVVAHATRWALDQRWPLSAVCCIYATAPFIELSDLRAGLEALLSGPWDFAFSVTDYSASIFRSFRSHPEGGLEMFFEEYFETRSQDLPKALHDAAQFYWGRPDAWLEQRRLFDRHSVPILIPRWRVQDIDDLDDWRRAETIFALRQQAK